jgi:hypothetical protein
MTPKQANPLIGRCDYCGRRGPLFVVPKWNGELREPYVCRYCAEIAGKPFDPEAGR